MVIDVNKDGPPTQGAYDVCVVGSGPAGTALARGLANTRLRVCVLESGGRRPTPFADSLRDLDCEGIQIKEYSRERVWGGTSSTWAGLSSPLDAVDLGPRDWVEDSGWPIGTDELAGWYAAASEAFRFPRPDRFVNSDWMGLWNRGHRRPAWSNLAEKVFLAADPPQHFGTEQAALYDGARLDLCLGATAIEVTGEAADGRAKGVLIGLPDGRRECVSARVVVLACGGIENARLLLNSRFACAEGLGNDHDQVGRRFMNHPKDNHGCIRLRQPMSGLPGYFGFLSPAAGVAGFVGLRLAEAEQARARVLNSYVRFEPVFDWSDSRAVAAMVFYLKRSRWLMKLFKRVRRDQLVELRDYSETGDDSDLMNRKKTLKDHLRLAGCIAREPGAVSRYLRSRMGNARAPRVTSLRLRNFLEMAPDPSNRVTLSDRMDRWGRPLAHVRHRCGDLDRRSLVVLHEVLGREVEANGWGRLESDLTEDRDPWPVNLDASHHLGATRMGVDPRRSVVDADCRLHTCENVYVAGGSVFPTSGCANPTYTLVALALRLAGHLSARLTPETVAGRTNASAV